MLDDASFLKLQILEIDQLIALSGDHPLMTPSLRSRKESIEKKLADIDLGEQDFLRLKQLPFRTPDTVSVVDETL